MDLDSYKEYIEGSRFSEDLKVNYGRGSGIVEKNDLIKKLIEGKQNIDLGFADHYELIDARIANKNWMHGLFRNWSARIIGIDVDPRAIEYIRSTFGLPDIYCHDITSPDLLPVIREQSWDYLIMSEVLEHIADPASFLRSIKTHYGENIKKLILSVPNAYGIVTLRSVLKGIERINSDHKFWFTPYTLAKVVSAAGLQVEEFVLCNSYFPLSRAEKIMVKRSPLLHHTLLMVASF